MAAGRLRIPAREIEDAARRRPARPSPHGCGRSPAGDPNAARWNSASVGRRAPRQRAIRRRLGLADVDRPRQRQRDQLEHPAPVPASPCRSQNSGCATRFAPAATPSPRAATTADRGSRRRRRTRESARWSRRDARSRTPATSTLVRAELVVPPERDRSRARRRASRSPAGISIHSARGDAPVDARLVAGRRALLLERQAMPHVEQRLLVHRLVLEDREHRFGAIEQRMARLLDVGVRERVDHLAIGFVGELRARRRAPASRRGRPAPPVVPARAAPAASRADRSRARTASRAGGSMLGAAEPFLHQRVEAERRQVAFVEHDRMAQRDRLAVVRVVGEQIEQRARALAVAPVPRRGGPSRSKTIPAIVDTKRRLK